MSFSIENTFGHMVNLVESHYPVCSLSNMQTEQTYAKKTHSNASRSRYTPQTNIEDFAITTHDFQKIILQMSFHFCLPSLASSEVVPLITGNLRGPLPQCHPPPRNKALLRNHINHHDPLIRALFPGEMTLGLG